MAEGTWPDRPSRAPPGFTWDENRDPSAPLSPSVSRPQSLSTSALWAGGSPLFQGVCRFDSRRPSIRQVFIPSGRLRLFPSSKIDWTRQTSWAGARAVKADSSGCLPPVMVLKPSAL